MSKKVISILLCAALLFALPLCVSAASPEDNSAVTDMYSTTIVVKTVSGELMYSYTIGGSFTWDGITAVASEPKDEYAVGEGWTCLSHKVWVDGPSVYGSAQFQDSEGNIREMLPVLTCSPTGEMS